jgi:hypothetical protein
LDGEERHVEDVLGEEGGERGVEIGSEGEDKETCMSQVIGQGRRGSWIAHGG